MPHLRLVPFLFVVLTALTGLPAVAQGPDESGHLVVGNTGEQAILPPLTPWNGGAARSWWMRGIPG